MIVAASQLRRRPLMAFVSHVLASGGYPGCSRALPSIRFCRTCIEPRDPDRLFRLTSGLIPILHRY